MNESIIEKYYSFVLIVLLFFLIGCATQSEDSKKGIPSEIEFSEDCMLLGMAVEQLTSDELHLAAPILSGCPGRYASRVPSQAEKRAFDTVLAEHPTPIWIRELGVETERQYNRLVKKGVPPRLVIKLLGHD